MTPEKFLKDTVELYCGDCLAVLDSLPENSVDAVLTDPPYHLTSIVQRFGSETAAPAKTGKTGAYARASAGFMGKKWDGGDIAFQPEVWAKVLRVLKPGAHLAAFGATRGYHRMACAIEDAGFEIRDSLAWMFGVGFPKSHDVALDFETTLCNRVTRIFDGKEIDEWRYKSDGAPLVKGEWRHPEARIWSGFGTALKPAFEPIVLARKPLGTGDIRVQENIEREIKARGWSGEIKWLNESVASATSPNNSKASLRTPSNAETFAATVDGRPTTLTAPPMAINSAPRQDDGTLNTGRSISTQQSGDTTNCATKFSDTTVANARAAANANPIFSPSTTSTAAEHSTENRLAGKFTPTCANEASPPDSERFAGIATGLTDSMETVHIRQEADSFVWPENLPTFVPSKPLTVAANVLRWGTGALNIDGCRVAGEKPTTTRGASSKASSMVGTLGAQGRIEDDGLGRWPANVVHDGSDEVVGAFPSAGGQQGRAKIGGAKGGSIYGKFAENVTSNPEPRGDSGSASRFFYSAKADGDDRLGSKHPTVKPVDLLQYFSRLITPPGGVILDLFAGTGSLGEAAFREGFRAILIEREGEYQSDIRKRMKLVLGSSRERRVAAKSAKKAHDHGPLFS